MRNNQPRATRLLDTIYFYPRVPGIQNALNFIQVFGTFLALFGCTSNGANLKCHFCGKGNIWRSDKSKRITAIIWPSIRFLRLFLYQEAAVHLNLVGWWSSRYDGPLYLVTSLDNGCLSCRYYRRRFQIETFFSDQKSRGFHLRKSHLADPAWLSRLLLAACMAYLWMVCQGLLVIAEKEVGLIARTDCIDKSLFRLGLDWVHYAIKSNLNFMPLFRFQSGFLLPDVRQQNLDLFFLNWDKIQRDRRKI